MDQGDMDIIRNLYIYALGTRFDGVNQLPVDKRAIIELDY